MQHYRDFLDERHAVHLSRWMDAAGSPTAWQPTGSQPSTNPFNQVATIYYAAVNHVGNAKSHHFFIRYPHEVIGQQLKCLMLSMAQYLLTMPALEPAPHDATTVSNSLQVTRGLVTTSIPNILLSSPGWTWKLS